SGSRGRSARAARAATAPREGRRPGPSPSAPPPSSGRSGRGPRRPSPPPPGSAPRCRGGRFPGSSKPHPPHHLVRGRLGVAGARPQTLDELLERFRPQRGRAGAPHEPFLQRLLELAPELGAPPLREQPARLGSGAERLHGRPQLVDPAVL